MVKIYERKLQTTVVHVSRITGYAVPQRLMQRAAGAGVGVAVGHHHDHRLGLALGNEVLHDLNHSSALRPRTLVAADPMQQIQHRVFTIFPCTIYHLVVCGGQINAHSSVAFGVSVVPGGADQLSAHGGLLIQSRLR